MIGGGTTQRQYWLLRIVNMSYTSEQVKKLFQQGEGQHTEFKVKLPEPNLVARLIGGFANANGGVILVGADERGHIVGIEDPRMFEDIVQVALRQLRPAPVVTTQYLDIDGKTVGIIRVDKSRRLVASREGIYVRKYDRTVPMSAPEIEASLVATDLSTDVKLLAQVIEQQSDQIERLRKQLESANKLRSKILDWIWSGLIGAVLGIVLTLLAGG